MKNYNIEDERREYRRKRKRRNQAIAYIVLFFVLIAMGIGAVAGMKIYNGKKPVQEDVMESSQVIQNLLASEEMIEVPEVTEVVPELTAEEKLDLFIEEMITEMTLAEKVAGLFFVMKYQS